jgi:hypothetical protein
LEETITWQNLDFPLMLHMILLEDSLIPQKHFLPVTFTKGLTDAKQTKGKEGFSKSLQS